jgi:heme exporter protein A
MAMSGHPILQAEDVSVARGGRVLLKHVTFTLDPGAALILKAPNGFGKTTLLRTLAGLQPVLSGRVQLDPDTAVYAGHTDGLKPTLSVVENLRFWADIFGTETIADSLRLFELEALQTRLAGSLSAGQKRRLGLSRLWLAKRRVWLLDEPTVSLDQQAVGQFAAMVGAHLQAGGAAVIATHIDLGLDARAQILDLAQFKVKGAALERTDEAFL